MDTLKLYMEAVKSETDAFIKQKFTKNQPKYLYDPIYYVILNGGKKVRPTILLLSAEMTGKKRESVMQLAVGIEFFHIFSLVHDDIMDRDDYRRGNLTIHKKWDEPTAILAGDGLIALSNMLMMSFQHERVQAILNVYSETILAVCEGQAFDKEFEQRQDVSLSEYLNMISLKTAWLLGASAKIGAITGSDDPAVWQHHFDFGYNLGIAFQIQDDILDLYADIENFGKDIGSDLFNEKNSILSIYAKEMGQLPKINRYDKSLLNIESIKQQFKDSGVLQKAIDLKESYTNKARLSLEQFDENQYKLLSLELINMLNRRVN